MINKKRIFFLSFLLLVTSFVQAQNTFNFVISNRVNFEEDSVRKEVLQLYENYLDSRPDTTRNNPYWNKKEKEQEIPNLSYGGLFNGYTIEELKRTFDFYVLSIEKLDNISYSIRVMMITKGGLKYGGSSVWCIHRVTAIKEDNKWCLQNNLVQETAKWKNYSLGNINYHFKDSFNYPLATKAINFIDSIKTTFDVDCTDTLNYYVAKDVDELGRLIGFDYLYSAYTTGVAGFNHIISTKGEFYAHELVHFVLKLPQSNYLIQEGIAEFLGTKKQNKERYYNWFNKLFKDILSKNYTIDSLLNQSVEYNGYNYKYPFGALLCELVYEKKGIKGLKKLMFSDTSETDSLRAVLSNILSIKPKKLDKFIFNFVKSKEQLYKSLWEKYKR